MLVDDIWLDASNDGAGSIIRMSVRPEEMSGLDVTDGRTFDVPIHGPDGLIAYADVRFVAFIRWRAILEVVGLRSAGSESPPQRPSVSLFSASLPERT